MKWTGRQIFKTSLTLARFYQGPYAERTFFIDLTRTRVRFGRRCLRVPDPRDPRGYVDYAQAKALPPGYGVPERWQTIDERGRWTDDSTRYHPGEYDPKEQELPWEEFGAEGDPGGDLE